MALTSSSRIVNNAGGPLQPMASDGLRLARSAPARRFRLGILGGMGPLASAEFLKTVYRLNLAEPEQRMPICIHISDPSFPDRSEAILAGATEELAASFSRALEELADLGAERLLVACITIHHLLPGLREPLRRKIISLIDLIADDVLASPRPRLLLATHGTRATRLFERHSRWEQLAPWLRFPEAEDQRAVHDWIYRLKIGEAPAGCCNRLAELALKYGVDGFVFACTELHLCQQEIAARPAGEDGFDVIDPLLTAARRLQDPGWCYAGSERPELAEATGA